MGKYIMRKKLTPEQFKMANGTMGVIMVICYLTYIVTEVTNQAAFWPVRCGIFAILGIISIVLSRLKATSKKTMIFYAITFLVSYLLLVMNNGIATMALAFPILIGFMLYMNSLLTGIGCFIVFIICAMKCTIVRAGGNEEMFDLGNLITVGFIISIYGSYKAIDILYRFSEMDRDVIVKEALASARTILLEVNKLGEETGEIKSRMLNELVKLDRALNEFEVPNKINLELIED